MQLLIIFHYGRFILSLAFHRLSLLPVVIGLHWQPIITAGISTVISILILLSLFKMHQLVKQNRNNSMSRSLRFLIIGEHSKIKHEYHNIFQTILNMIEAGDMAGITDYKNYMLERVHAASRNNLIQLGKIKAETILKPVYQLLEYSLKEHVVLNLSVFSIITNEFKYEKELYFILEECFHAVLHMAEDEHREVNMGIRESYESIFFHFECNIKSGKEIIHITPIKLEGRKLRKHLSCNTYIKENRFVWELNIRL